jgi:hypothetical protein
VDPAVLDRRKTPQYMTTMPPERSESLRVRGNGGQSGRRHSGHHHLVVSSSREWHDNVHHVRAVASRAADLGEQMMPPVERVQKRDLVSEDYIPNDFSQHWQTALFAP